MQQEIRRVRWITRYTSPAEKADGGPLRSPLGGITQAVRPPTWNQKPATTSRSPGCRSSTVDVRVIVDDTTCPPRAGTIRANPAARAQAQTIEAKAASETAALVRELAQDGVPTRDIATLTGVSFNASANSRIVDQRNKTGQAFRPGLLSGAAGESNPGPTAFPQDFSVRSSLCLYLDLLLTRTSQDDDPSRCLMSR